MEVGQRVQDRQRWGIREQMCPSWPGIAPGFKWEAQQPRKPFGPRHTQDNESPVVTEVKGRGRVGKGKQAGPSQVCCWMESVSHKRNRLLPSVPQHNWAPLAGWHLTRLSLLGKSGPPGRGAQTQRLRARGPTCRTRAYPRAFWPERPAPSPSCHAVMTSEPAVKTWFLIPVLLLGLG